MWTGPGFARVLPGTGLRFIINNIPFLRDFTTAAPSEAQVPSQGENAGRNIFLTCFRISFSRRRSSETDFQEVVHLGSVINQRLGLRSVCACALSRASR